MNIDALLHNMSTAIGDTGLVGETLMVPLKKCLKSYRYTFSAMNPEQELSQRIGEIFKRSAEFLAASLAFVPSLILAGIGSISKLVDLYRNFDTKVSPQSEVSSYLPPILKPFSRTGDRVAAYLRARIVADQTGMPLHYTPFKGSEIFAFDELETNRGPKYYREVVYINTQQEVERLQSVDKLQSVLYLIPFASFNRELERESATCSLPKYQPNWTKHQLRLRQLLRVESEMLNIPENTYKIALHVRDGGDYDDANTKTLHPLKLPSLNFYTGELSRVIKMKKEAGEKVFFVHIFTDALNPKAILEKIQSQVQVDGVEIQFSYTPKEQATLEYDVGNMGRFDCMIRADSNLSGPIVSASGTPLDIFPSGFDTRNNEVVISEVTQDSFSDRSKQAAYYSKPMEGWLPSSFNRFFYNYFAVHQVPLPL